MIWVAFCFIGLGGLLTWGALRNSYLNHKERAEDQDALIRGAAGPVERSWLSKSLGGLIELSGWHSGLGPLLLVVGLGGLFLD